MSIKVRVEREVSIASAFTHLIAAWDVNPYPWFRKVHYTRAGLAAIQADMEPRKTDVLAIVTMWRDDGESTGRTKKVKVTGQWIARTFAWCLVASPNVGTDGWSVNEAARLIIDDSSRCDQDTADVVMQVGAYGRVVFA